MTPTHIIKTALTGLRLNKSRSALTILGIVIGITAIILVMSLGDGAQNLILGQIQGMGSKTIAVVPGRQVKGPSDAIQSFSDSLKNKDLEALLKKENAPTITKVAPIVFGGESASYGNDTYRLSVFGGSDLLFNIYDLKLESGRFFNDDDVKNKADVAVIGPKIKDELFSTENPIGLKIKIRNKTFKIIGVLEKKGQSSFINFDDAAFVPYTSAQQYIFGIKYFHRIVVEAMSEELVPKTAEDIERTLMISHGITDPDKKDFNIETMADAMKTVETITSALTLFLAAVAAISLLVGGVGIMNIMLVSVTERTREIGLRKALGATEKNILMQFLAESTLLTATGGAIGVALGALFSFIISFGITKGAGLDWPFSFSFFAALLGITAASLIGLIFGLYPAKKAAAKNPIEALRYE
jgi:putative ABC transport system permease protein